MTKRIIAIDPGKAGAITLREGNNIIDVVKMPDTCTDLRDYIEAIALACQQDDIELVAYLEQVHSMPGNKPSSMFTFGRQFGNLEQVLADYRIRTITVRPEVWQKALSLTDKGIPKPEHKRRLKARSQSLFPQIKVTQVNQDSLLISEYAYLLEK